MTCKAYVEDLVQTYQWNLIKIEKFLSGKVSNSKVRFCNEVIQAAILKVREEFETKGIQIARRSQSKDSLTVKNKLKDNYTSHFHSTEGQHVKKQDMIHFMSTGSGVPKMGPIPKIKPFEETHLSLSDKNAQKDKSDKILNLKTKKQDNHEDVNVFYHSTPTKNQSERIGLVTHSTPEYSKTICPSLRGEKWCPTGKKCPYLHPTSDIVCSEWMETGICETVDCNAQHPNETTVDKIKGFTWKRYETETNLKVTTKMKEDALYASPPGMTSTVCASGGMCDRLTCRQQHKQVEEVHVTKKKGYLVDVTSNSYYYNKVINDMKMQCLSGEPVPHITKIEMIVNKKLEAKYQEYFDHKRKEKKVRPTEITAYHGTTKEAIESIVRKGFNLSKVKRAVYGKGMYCAQDPNVSVNYTKGSGKLLIVQLCTEGLKYVSDKRYYVVKEVSAMLPTYIVTFEEI